MEEVVTLKDQDKTLKEEDNRYWEIVTFSAMLDFQVKSKEVSIYLNQSLCLKNVFIGK